LARRPRKREPGRERAMLGLASLETWSWGALGTSGAQSPGRSTRLERSTGDAGFRSDMHHKRSDQT
ncbi:hypothetical protein, partial [Nocardia asiatica]